MPHSQNDPSKHDPSRARHVPAGIDCLDEARGLGVSTIQFKVAGPKHTDLLGLENTFHAKGGPPRHRHLAQDEWFYVVEGEFELEVGDPRFRLLPGDSVFAPRQVPHVWAHIGNGRGRMLIVFTPAGQMEAFFRVMTPQNAMPLIRKGEQNASASTGPVGRQPVEN